MADEDDNEIGSETDEIASSPLTSKSAPTSNYPGNSYKDRDKPGPTTMKVEPGLPDKQVARIVEGDVVQRKKPLGRKILETFSVENNKAVGEYVMLDVLVPGAKDLLVDALIGMIERKFYGSARGRRVANSTIQAGQTVMKTAYNKIASPSVSRAGQPDVPSISKQGRATHDFAEIIIPDKGQAELVLDTMIDMVQQYSVISVYDFYALCGITGEFPDQKWGWDDLRASSVDRVRDGYLLNLPKPKPLGS